MTDPLFYLDRTMLTVAPDRVRRITLARGGAEQTVARLEAGTWAAVNPPTNDVNRAAVEDVLFLAANLRAARVEARNPRSLAGYGLECPQTVLTLVMSGGDGIQKSVFLGLAAGADGHYAIVQGQDVVFVLPRGTVQRLSGDLVKPLALEPAGRGKGNEDPAPAVRTAS
jgi:hypothetical protein